MTQCVVECRTCRTEAGNPQRFHWLCEECAEDCLASHRRRGHDVDLTVTREPSTESVVLEINRIGGV